MKRVVIYAWEKAIVYRNREIHAVLGEGKYWFKFTDQIVVVDMSQQLYLNLNTAVLLKSSELLELVHLVELKNHEIALVFENGVFKKLLQVGTHFFWKGLVDYTFLKVDLNQVEISDSINPILLQSKELSPLVRTYFVEQTEAAYLVVNGELTRNLQPGSHNFWKNGSTIQVLKADLRTTQLEVSGQEILTRDKASVRISLFVEYAVVNIEVALLKNKEFEKQLYVRAQLALRDQIGAMTLDEILEKKS